MPKQFMRNPFMWELDFDGNFDAGQESLLTLCMKENLNHARHIENERMNLLVGVAAMVAGVLAVGSSLLTTALSSADVHTTMELLLEIFGIVMIFIVTMAVVVLAKLLNRRWNNAFDRHLYYAKNAYYMLHRENFELKPEATFAEIQQVPDNLCDEQDPEKAFDISAGAFQENFSLEAFGRRKTLDILPLYCFSINRDIDRKNRVVTRSTKKYFNIFYNILFVILAIITVAAMASFFFVIC